MGLTVLMGGQNITHTVDEYSIQIKDTLGQAGGTGGYAVGRASTAQFLTTLGPMASAVGAGTSISSPTLMRQGEVRISDISGTCIFGGYAGKLEDKTDLTRVYTQIDCYDYWQHLDRIIATELYVTQTDIQIIRSLCAKYAPWLNLSLIPLMGSYVFNVKNYKGQSVQKILADITTVTGFIIWVDNNKYLHYVSPANSPAAPFSVSTNPNFYTSFPFAIDSYEIDDNAAISRVTFFGGKTPSKDFTQDLSTQANGSNTLFVLAYYPRKSSDGLIHIKVGGVDKVLGYLLGSGTQNEFKSKGGLCDVLLNADAHTLQFDIAPSNTGPLSVSATYRYEYPLVVQIEDPVAYRLYGQHLDGVISDETVYDQATAVSRCRVLLDQQSQGLAAMKLHCYKAGLFSGQILSVYHPIRGISTAFLIQEVDVKSLGAGFLQYDVSLGSWRWDLVDVVLNAVRFASAPDSVPSDSNGQSAASVVDVSQLAEIRHADDSLITINTTSGGTFYARSSPSHDGHDAYPGFCTA